MAIAYPGDFPNAGRGRQIVTLNASSKLVDPFDIRGRVALVTGATGHLGRSMARGLAAAGAKVFVNARHSDRAAQLSAEIIAAGGVSEPLAFDVTHATARAEALRRIQNECGQLDILVNNAVANLPDAGFSDHYRVAVEAPAALVAESLEMLAAAARQNAGGSSVINICSMYGSVSPYPPIYEPDVPPSPLPYGPSKAGQLQLTRHLAALYGPRRIRVNGISPGPFPNEQIQAAYPEFIQRLAGRNPLGRIGRPEELIGPLLFLASDASSYVTGTSIAVDGGWTAW